MIETVYSKINKSLILFSAMNVKDVSDKRIDASPEKEYLQSSISILKKGFSINDYPNTKSYYEEALSLPIYFGLTEVLIQKVVQTIFDIVSRQN